MCILVYLGSSWLSSTSAVEVKVEIDAKDRVSPNEVVLLKRMECGLKIFLNSNKKTLIPVVWHIHPAFITMYLGDCV